MTRKKAVIVGAVESTYIALDLIAQSSDWELAALVTLPLANASRHSDFVDLRDMAAKAGGRVIEAANSNDPDIVQQISDINPDIMFVIGWSQICGPAFMAAAGGNVVGYHPAPLPQMRGRAAIPWTILLNQSITASTLFWIDEGVDSGPILAQKFIHIAPDETATTLYARHLNALGEIFTESLGAIAAGTARRDEQDHQYASWTTKRTPKDGLVNWNDPVEDVWRLIRATTRPYPGAYTVWDDEKLVLWSAAPWPEGKRYNAMPGQVLAIDGSGIAVQCGDGALWIDDWSLGGDKKLRLHVKLGA